MKDLETLTFFTQLQKHYYTFACTGLKLHERNFTSRQCANEYMYNQCAKHGLKVEEVWKDNHDVTFVCNNGVKFYIQRV